VVGSRIAKTRFGHLDSAGIVATEVEGGPVLCADIGWLWFAVRSDAYAKGAPVLRRTVERSNGQASWTRGLPAS
jgi:hypothetical protein